MDNDDIKSMKLYTHVQRVYNELAELGVGEHDRLRVENLSCFDQLHYHGTDALDKALELLGIQSAHHLLEIGSGIGGPARYLAAASGARLTALELQQDQNLVAEDLTRRCGLEKQVTHICANFFDYDEEAETFDAIVSWLALYHIPERGKLLSKCSRLLKPGGKFYTEDLGCRGQFTEEELQGLKSDLYAITLPTMEQYVSELDEAGFELELIDDMSDDWSNFTSRRLAGFRLERSRHVRVHGESTVGALEDFYSAVDHYFQSGKLAGIRLMASKR